MTSHLSGCKDGRKDGRSDARKDVHVDVFTSGRKDETDDTLVAGAPSGCDVIVLANHKGGVTKTTSTANLGAMLAERGRRVLIVDCDPQANLSEAFGWTEDLPESGSRTCLLAPPQPPNTDRRWR